MGGVVSELMVRDGDRVRAGDVVMRLDATMTKANLSIILKSLDQFAADWFHPNDRGHRVWAQAFWRAIDGSPQLDRLTGPGSALPDRSG